jgi:hypothetical protein
VSGVVLSPLEEWGGSLGWSPDRRLIMTWVYFDESGEHERGTGRLRRLVLGGCVASYDAWRHFEDDWRQVLADFGIASFHMTDFEGWKEPFDFRLANGERDWVRHRALLDRVLSAIETHAEELIGFRAEPDPGRKAFVDSYDQALAKACKEHWIDANRRDDRAQLVFAKHKEISAERIGRYVDLWNEGGERLSFSVCNPTEILPLQAADVIAYEMSRWGREVGPDQERYPLRRLKESFRLNKKHAKFILTFV